MILIIENLNTHLSGSLFFTYMLFTDTASVFSVMTGQNVKDKLFSTLEAESFINNPMCIFFTQLIRSIFS